MSPALTRIASSKTLFTGLIATVVISLAGTTAAYLTLTKPVTLIIDGQSRQIRTMGDTVGEVLDARSVKTHERDEITPSLDSPVTSDLQIAVNYLRPVTIEVDGLPQTHWTTARQVSDVLDQADLDTRGSQLSVSRGASIERSGMTLSITTPKTVKLKVANQPMVSITAAVETVADLLDEAGVAFDADDLVTPSAEAALQDGQKVIVTKRATVTKTVADEVIPSPIKRREDPNADIGTKRTLVKGTDGLLHISAVKPGERVETVEDVLSQGDELDVTVVEVDRERGRIGLRRSDDPAIAGKSKEELASVGSGDRGPRRGGGDRGRGRDRGGRGERRGGDRERRRRD